MDKNRELISVKDTADLLGVNVRTVYRYLYSREITIPYQKIGGRIIMYRDDVEKFISSNEGNLLIKAVRNREKK